MITTREAFQKYEQWCADGHPKQNLADTLVLAIGFWVNYTDGSPDYDERAFLGLLSQALKTVDRMNMPADQN